MKKLIPAFVALIAAMSFSAAFSATIDLLEFENPAQEERYNDLIKELRCLVCQNQSLADSDAELAKDLRGKAYEMVRADRSDQDIVDYMVDRYGDFVLYRPPLNASTILLWVGPFVILVICLVLLVRRARRRKSEAVVEFDDEQHANARRLLRED